MKELEWNPFMAKHLKPCDDWEKSAFETNYRLSRLQARLGGNARQVCRQSQKKWRMNAEDWLHLQKTSTATTLLLIEGWRVKDVADAVGFTSWRGFDHFFRKETGLSPKEFVRSHGKSPGPSPREVKQSS